MKIAVRSIIIESYVAGRECIVHNRFSDNYPGISFLSLLMAVCIKITMQPNAEKREINIITAEM